MAQRQSTRPPALPLKHRVPNGPAVFVGRDRELDALRERLERAPLAVVVGPDGLGKTSLVVHAVRRALGEEIERALYLAVEPDEPAEQVRYRLLHALARASGESGARRKVSDDPEAVVAAAIDLAEQSGRWVVLDDVHHAETGETEQILIQLASYARRSRWIATSRAPMRLPALTPCQLELPRMSDRDLRELARALVPDSPADVLSRAIQAASGSPWLLQQWAAVGERGLAHSRNELLATLAPESADLLRAVAVLHGSFSTAILASFVTVPDDAQIETLERRGLVQRRAWGLAVHDVVRGLLFSGREHASEERAWMARAAAGLANTHLDEALLEAMRLYVQLGRLDEVRQLLSSHGDQLLSRGHAPGLWQVVAHLADPSLARFRLRCAAELGNPTALAEVDSPEAPDAAERLAWAHTLHAQGDLAGAIEQAHAAATEAASNGERRTEVEARLLAARCQGERGSASLAAESLRGVEADGALGLRVAAACALASAIAGDAGPADRAYLALRDAGEGDDAEDAAHDLAEAFAALGRRDAADELLQVILATRRGGRASLLRARQAMATHARLLVERGELDEAAELVKSMRPFARPPSVLRPSVLELEAWIDLVLGRMDGLVDRIDAVIEAADRVDAGCALRSRCTRIEAALTLGVPAMIGPPVESDRVESAELALWRSIASSHAGNLEQSAAAADVQPHHRVLAQLARSTHALVAGRPADAVEAARTGARLARKQLSRVLEASLLRAEGDALAAVGGEGDLEATAALLHEAATTLGSARFALEASLWLAADEPAELERIAGAFHASPAAARRARSLLGGDPPLDAVDRVVVDALLARRGGGEARTVCASSDAWTSGWGLDARRQAVWLPDGRVIDLAKKPLLWRVLVTLAMHGGSATKEELVLEAWQEREYHPVRHDSRLHVSVRKLRELIEDDPASPERLLTAEDGYRLAAPLRWLG